MTEKPKEQEKSLRIPLSAALHKRLKILAAKEDRTVRALVTELVERYVISAEKKASEK